MKEEEIEELTVDEPKEVKEEPVMIIENIEETSPKVPTPTTTSPQTEVPENPVELPKEMPDLGGQESTQSEEKITPSFADFPTDLTDSYQAKSSSEQEPQLQTTNDEDTVLVEEYDEEEEEEPRKRKILPLILIGIALIAVIIVGMMGLRTRGEKGPINILRPERSSTSKMNIVVLGDTKQANDEVIATIQKNMGVSTETVDSCSEKVTNRISYSLRTVEIKLNDISYNVTNACEKDSTIKYLMVSEGDQTVDGAILVVKASSGVTQEVKDYLHTLNKIGIEKVVVYIVEDADSSKVEEELKETLEDNRFDRDNTPIVKGSTTEEEKMEELITKANNWIEKMTFYQEPSVVLSYDKMKLYTYFLQDLDSAEDLAFTINKVKYQPKVTLEKGHEKMTTGEIQEITIKLEEGIPAETGMRVMIKRGDTLIGIGVISELK